MRLLAGALALIALAACNPNRQRAESEGCVRTATHSFNWTNESTPDVATARAEGPSCAQAVVTLVIRNAEGDPLWTLASTYYDMTIGGRTDPTPVPEADVDRFLASWVDVTLNHSRDLPEWREGTESLSQSADGMSYFTDLDRETYENLRARNLPQVCYAAAVEASQCLVIDPLSNAPIMIVSFGV